VIEKLSERDRQIVALLLRGWDNKAIAGQLGMPLRTVKAHFHRMFRQFGITTGIKRVKLAVLMYNAQLRKEENEKCLAL
jgi:DNA-binding NarL/FixJ family response regulator